MKAILAAVIVLGATSASATTLYEADFSQPVSIDHDTGTAAAPLEPTPQAGANFVIGYTLPLSTDSTRNFFETDGDSLVSSDFGGLHFMISDMIDVSGWTNVLIDFTASFLGIDSFNNSPVEFIEYYYALDGGPQQQFFYFTDDPNGTDLNASVTVATAGFSSLVVGLNAYVDGASDGFDLTSATVTGVAAVPLPAGLPLLLVGLSGLALAGRKRRA